MAELWTVQLGVVEYREAWRLQERVRDARMAGAIPDTLLLLEHPPVYTRGRRTEPGELGRGEAWYRERGVDIVDVDRGGKVTYHGPGQLVGYPIVAIDDVPSHIRAMEDAIVAAAAEEGVTARPGSVDGPEHVGVWVDGRKLASIGVRVTRGGKLVPPARGVTTHGFAVNVDNDMAPWEWIVACGLPDAHMTSLALETGRTGLLPCFRKRAAHAFARTLGRRQRIVPAARLVRELEACELSPLAG